MNKDQALVGIALIIVSSTAFAFAPTFASISYDSGANAVGTLLARFVMASILMLVVRKVWPRQTRWPKPVLFVQIFSLGAFGYFTASLLYFSALKNIDSGLAIVIYYCNPVMVVLLSWWLLATKPNRIIVWCLGATLIGVSISAGQVGQANYVSVIMVLAVAVIYAFYIIVGSKILPNVDLLTSVTIVMLGVTSSYLIYFFVAPDSTKVNFPGTTNGWISVFALASISTVFATATFYAGMKRIGASKTAIVQNFEPVVAITAGVVVLNEAISLVRIVGAVLVIGAVVALTMAETRNNVPILHQ